MHNKCPVPGWSIILAFQFQFVILSVQIGFVSIATVTKYVLIVCYDHRIGNSLIEINTKIVFKLRSIITKFSDPCRSARHSSTLLLIGRQMSRDLFLAFYRQHFYVFRFLKIRYLELVQLRNAKSVFYDFWQTLPILYKFQKRQMPNFDHW